MTSREKYPITIDTLIILNIIMAKRKRRRRRKSRSSKKKKPVILSIPDKTMHSVTAVALMVLGVLTIVSFSGQGTLMQSTNDFLSLKLGSSMVFLPFIFISAGFVMLRGKWAWSKPHVLLGAIMISISTMVLTKSGEIGRSMFRNFANLISPTGTYLAFFALGFAGFLIMTQWSLEEITSSLSSKKKKKEDEEDKKGLFVSKNEDASGKSKGFNIPKLSLGLGKKKFEVHDGSEFAKQMSDDGSKVAVGGGKAGTTMAAAVVTSKQPAGKNLLLDDAPLTPSNTPVIWEYPPLTLLSDNPGGKAKRGDVKANAQIIENTLDSFGIKARVAEVNYGPAVTQYALEITKGTRLSKITSLGVDLALALAAPTGQIRIEAPIAGRSLVGIEVPNYSAEFVTLRQMLASKTMKEQKSKLAVSMGIDVSGQPVVADISKMPHVLIAGATGSGKSVAINSFLSSILFRASPDEVKLILVDPKRVELTGYNNIPHLLTPVIVEPSKVVSALKWLVNQMDVRYKQLAEVGVRNIHAYNELAGLVAMPHIVIVIDELADIMLFAPKEVEESITRIAQMARAVGIHLVLATQRPSVDVITGLIKANVPTRIAFNVSSQTDSRVILDTSGAEKLLGRGDMLYLPSDKAKPVRLQGTFVSDKETRALVDFLKSQGQKPEYIDDITTKYKPGMLKGGSGGNDGVDRDSKFAEAAKLFSQYDKASSSLIQRRLSVGYARAARILDQLYEAGMVGPPEGSKPREVNNEKIQDYLGSLENV